MIEVQAGILVIDLPLGGGYRLELMVSLSREWYGLDALFHTWGREQLREFRHEPHSCYGQLHASLTAGFGWIACDVRHKG